MIYPEGRFITLGCDWDTGSVGLLALKPIPYWNLYRNLIPDNVIPEAMRFPDSLMRGGIVRLEPDGARQAYVRRKRR